MYLRRLVYLVIKELATSAKDIIMVTSSLTQDINCSKYESTYRANAIRALCKITDSSLIQGIERFIKQAIVDKSHLVVSAALISASHLYSGNKEFVKRWTSEIQAHISSSSSLASYHAVGILSQIKSNDQMAILKLCQKLQSSPSQHVLLLMLRMYGKLCSENPRIIE